MKKSLAVACTIAGLGFGIAGDVAIQVPEGFTPSEYFWSLRGDVAAIMLESEDDPSAGGVLLVRGASDTTLIRVAGRVTYVQVSEDAQHLLIDHDPAGDEMTATTTLANVEGDLLWSYREPVGYFFSLDGSHVWSRPGMLSHGLEPAGEKRGKISVYRTEDAGWVQSWDVGDCCNPRYAVIPGDGSSIFIPRKLGYMMMARRNGELVTLYEKQFPADPENIIQRIDAVGPRLLAVYLGEGFRKIELIDVETGDLVFDWDPELLAAQHPGREPNGFRGFGAKRGSDDDTVLMMSAPDSRGWSLSLSTGEVTERFWDLEPPPGFVLVEPVYEGKALFVSEREIRIRSFLPSEPK